MTKDEVKLAPIGLRVKVADILRRNADGTKREWITYRQWIPSKSYSPRLRHGYLVGFASLSNGDAEWFDDHFEWTTKGDRVFAARVKFGPSGREHYARPEDIEVAECEISVNITLPETDRLGIPRDVLEEYCVGKIKRL